MEHKGLVERIEAELEQGIALGRYPRGSLPSEHEMARRYGVSRTTIRAALQRLAAKRLITRHPGRRTRTVAVGEVLTLENLKLVLPEEGRADPARRKLLEGYFALKREITVDLLAACCQLAPKEDLDLLSSACFLLRDEAHWELDRSGWVRQEFELMRLAAHAVDRPGHALLVQSLEQAFWGFSERVLPHLQGPAIEEWAMLAFHALLERDGTTLRRELSARLMALDVQLLDHLAPAPE
ncbi:FadR/GntR family transcriptional regulator [Hyalangium versicolor]|uniref:FadR/GntR family transcriptional regulator n=1 Tax=Hyalangium versicolor TaxID=2861190 RepID=UPI001CCB00C9|nr:GntR family transcriptional regulator [Hyalangium versicolor]